MECDDDSEVNFECDLDSEAERALLEEDDEDDEDRDLLEIDPNITIGNDTCSEFSPEEQAKLSSTQVPTSFISSPKPKPQQLRKPITSNKRPNIAQYQDSVKKPRKGQAKFNNNFNTNKLAQNGVSNALSKTFPKPNQNNNNDNNSVTNKVFPWASGVVPGTNLVHTPIVVQIVSPQPLINLEPNMRNETVTSQTSRPTSNHISIEQQEYNSYLPVNKWNSSDYYEPCDRSTGSSRGSHHSDSNRFAKNEVCNGITRLEPLSLKRSESYLNFNNDYSNRNDCLSHQTINQLVVRNNLRNNELNFTPPPLNRKIEHNGYFSQEDNANQCKMNNVDISDYPENYVELMEEKKRLKQHIQEFNRKRHLYLENMKKHSDEYIPQQLKPSLESAGRKIVPNRQFNQPHSSSNERDILISSAPDDAPAQSQQVKFIPTSLNRLRQLRQQNESQTTQRKSVFSRLEIPRTTRYPQKITVQVNKNGNRTYKSSSDSYFN